MLEATREEQLGVLLIDVLRLLRADFSQRARGVSLTPQLHRLLLLIHRNPRCRQVQLAEWLEITPVTVGRMLDRLEKQELIRRDGHPDDRRATCVELDPKALPLVQRLAGFAAATRARALEGLGADERAALVNGLRRVHENLLREVPQRTTRGAGNGR
jgi:DNA-binding MarR family transcriptional regulator